MEIGAAGRRGRRAVYLVEGANRVVIGYATTRLQIGEERIALDLTA